MGAWAFGMDVTKRPDMAEFGHTLPPPGAEQQCIEQPPVGLREHLLKLNANAMR
jgi:hypothetical protein